MAYLDKIKVNNTDVDVHDSRIPNEPVTSVNGETGDVTITIPAAVTESTVSGWGFTKNTGTYSKPSGGIPASDLAAGVIPTVPTKVSDLTNDSGFITGYTETDPVYSASAASGITSNNITSWNGKAEKIAEINHGTSNTTFALTPNIMHIWGEVSSLTLTLSSGSSGILNEYMFKFTCPSAQATTINLPSTVKWVQTPLFEAGKTYEVSIVNNLAGYLTDGMENGGSSSGNSGIPIVNQTLTSTEIEPNCFNVWGIVSSLTITLASPEDNTIVNEYMIQFTSGTTATNLSFTNTIKWMSELNIAPNHTYQISIVNNIGVIGGVSI